MGSLLPRLRHALTPPDPSFDVRARGRLDRFVAALPPEARILDVGCGNRPSVAQAVGVDVRPTVAAACVADGHALPFHNATFDAVTSFAVLEHVRDPRAVMSEMLRVLKPGGSAYIVAPFLQGYHPECDSDADYWRFSLAGLRRLCSRFDEEDTGVATGPMSSLAWVLREIAAAPLFRRRYAVKPIRFLAGWLTALIKTLDGVAVYFPGAHRVASSVYFIGRKPDCAPLPPEEPAQQTNPEQS